MSITHVLVSYSSVLVEELERRLPPRSVLVVEDEEVLAARRVRDRVAGVTCVAQVLAAPVQDAAAWHELARRVARPPALRAVVPATEYGVGGAAALAEAWAVPGLGARTAWVLRDKAALRAALDGVVAQPTWQLCETLADADVFLAGRPDGCVVKPVGRQGSIGVHLVTSQAGLREAWRDLGALTERARANASPEDRVLVEGRLSGDEVSVESVVCDGRVLFTNVTAKELFGGARPVERGHLVPSPVPSATRARLVDAVARLVARCGVSTAVLHSEWILVDGEPHLVECGARLPGDGITTLIDLAYGTSFVGAFLALLAGEEVALPAGPSRAAGVRFLSAPPGVVDDVAGVDAARTLPGVEEATCALEPGVSAAATVDSNTRHGHVLATGDDSDQVRRTLDRAERTIRIVTRPST
ncbi:ATP-grasp domain-containing protein [Cellulomonas bogoriensis]